MGILAIIRKLNQRIQKVWNDMPEGGNIKIPKKKTIEIRKKTGARIGKFSINSLVIDSNNSNIIYAGTDFGLYKSMDRGNTWEEKYNKIEDTITKDEHGRYVSGTKSLVVNFLSIDLVNTNIIYAETDFGLYKSIDGGDVWEEKENGLFLHLDGGYGGERVFFFNNPMIIDSQNLDLIYIEVEYREASTIIHPVLNIPVFGGVRQYSRMYKSTDGGNRWNGIDNDNSEVEKFSTWVFSKDPDIVYALEAFYNWILDQLMKKKDTFYRQLAENLRIHSFAINPNDSNIIYVGTDFGLYKSMDGGATWEEKYNKIERDAIIKDKYGSDVFRTKALMISFLSIDPASTNIIYAATFSRLYKSTDGGDTWKEKYNTSKQNLETKFTIKTIVINPIATNIIYMGTSNGLYKSIDGGDTWS